MRKHPEEYAVIDIETTGFSNADSITELAAVTVKDGIVQDSFSSIVRPTKPIPRYVERLTGITNAQAAQAEPIEVVLPCFLAFVGHRPVVGHNVNFDLRFIRNACEQLDIPFELEKLADTLAMARERFPQYRRHNLATLADRLNIEQESAHQALADVMTTVACYEKMRDMPPAWESYEELYIKHCEWQEANRLGRWEKRFTPNLEGISICITGELECFSREEILQTIEKYHGTPYDRVVKSLTYLVTVPDYDPNSDYKTTKVKKAEHFIERGSTLEIINEQQLMEMLGYKAILGEP